jgi:hypothetical protein
MYSVHEGQHWVQVLVSFPKKAPFSSVFDGTTVFARRSLRLMTCKPRPGDLFSRFPDT